MFSMGRSQESATASDIVSRTEPLSRDHRRPAVRESRVESIALILVVLAFVNALEMTRADKVAGDTELAELIRGRPGQARKAGLSCRIRRLELSPANTCEAADIDDPSPARLDHARRKRTRAEEGT